MNDIRLPEGSSEALARTHASRNVVVRGASTVWNHRWFVLVVLVLLVLAAWQGARTLLGGEVVVDPVRRADLVRTVVASGHVENPFRVEIGAQVTGTVAEVLVDEGQRVSRGQVLVKLETQELQAAIVQANGAVAQARARLMQLNDLTLPTARESLAQASATFRNAQAVFDRTTELARTGHATRAALDEAQRALDVARTQVNAAQLQVFTASPAGSDHVLAQTQLDQAQAALQIAESRLAYATVTAPRDGILIARNVERGTVAQPGRALFVLAPVGTTQLVLQIDERNLGLVAMGQRALASADAYPDDRFAAFISYINPGIDITRSAVQVKLTVPEPPAYLRQDMTVSVDIEVARREATLVLPLRSIHEPNAAEPWVLVVREGRARRQTVHLGLRGNTQAEVLDGLAAGDIVVPTTAGVRAGQRLRPVFR